jgi:FMN-dependent NADH-azoreductase
VPARRAVVVSSRGSDYRPGTPAAAWDMQEPYLRLILGVLGIDDIEFVNVDRQGPSYPDAGDHVETARDRLYRMATDDPRGPLAHGGGGRDDSQLVGTAVQ